MSWLLDTVAVSELRTSRADPGLVAWAADQDRLALYLSAVSVLELDIGVRRKERSDPAQGAVLREWLEHVVIPEFTGRILPLDLAAARATAGLHVPDPRPVHDALIAGTALANGLTVVTRNVRDFEAMGVRVHNPWRD